ncbi:MAG: hypothetical protein HOE62_06745 [Alphaproteobacteria bacterium]|jgi:hypothetical protein|nr:hypothetical protein [Alphaproteobacteria bacterium]MBT4543545.1 hypothetical protein [Alphaproteobacteria bacterium]MBT7746675.1 hypothetical protein [Alphaproteobacteria bacterium]
MEILPQDDLRPQTETVTETAEPTASLSDINIADVTNLNFICALFHTVSKGALLWGTSFTQPPDEAPNSVWYGGVLTFRKLTGRNNFTSGKANVFYTVSSFFPDDDGNSSRSKPYFAAAHVITVDDVGDGPSAKIPWNRIKLPGSIVIETSPGNCQVVYILLVPITDANLFDRIIDALIHQGLAEKSDPGMKGVTRYARLPVGTNNKTKYDPPHRHVLKEWQPDLRYSVEDIIDAYGLYLAPPTPQRDFNSVKIEVEDDPYIEVFGDLGLILTGELRGESGNMLDILCPFHEEHTDRVDEGAVYFIGGGFKCWHGHCENRTFKDVKEKLRDDHWVDTDELDHNLRRLRVGPLAEVLKNV